MISDYVAIDPMALILHGNAYLIWVELRHPHVAAVVTLKEVLNKVPAADRAAILARAKALAAVGTAVVEAMPATAAAKS